MDDFEIKTDHDLLVIIATKQIGMQDSIDQFHDSQAFFNAAIGEKVRDIEVNGTRMAQENAKGLVHVCERVGALEDFTISHEAQVKQSAKIAGLVAGAIATFGVLVTIIVTIWYLGRP